MPATDPKELTALGAERARDQAEIERLTARIEEINARIRATCVRGPLTPREREVLALLLEGLQNKEIAARLGMGERTAKFHVSNILAKAGAENRVQLVTGKWTRTTTS